MKKINPIQIWVNGAIKIATILFAKVTNDNLQDAATFQYTLFETTENGYQGNQLTRNDLTMTGADYVAYSSNQDAYNWVAKQINATIIGEYVAPIKETPIATAPETTTPGTDAQPSQPITQP